VLARALRRLPGDYLAVYGHRVLAVETFTDPARHTGACYAAAGFQAVGDTLGYGRSAGTWRRTATRSGCGCARCTAMPPRSCPPHSITRCWERKDNRLIDLNALPFTGGRASLLEALATVSDPRKKRGIRHQIAATLTMVAAAGLSGSGRSFRSAGDFVAGLPQEALARLGARRHPVTGRHVAPTESTIRRHVQMIDADQADAAVGK
jgi:hypothetical protein